MPWYIGMWTFKKAENIVVSSLKFKITSEMWNDWKYILKRKGLKSGADAFSCLKGFDKKNIC